MGICVPLPPALASICILCIYLFTLCLMFTNYKVDTKMIILAKQNYE